MDGLAGPAPRSLPLCVDLDGTLLRSDLLVESALALLARTPLALFLLPWWLLHGKARLKREIARRVQLDPASLPYDGRVLELLRANPGRHRVLCTASDAALAQAVAAHLGCFDKVIAGAARAWVRALRLPKDFALARDLALHPDLQADGMDPQHWHLQGRPEGRRYRPGRGTQ